MNKVIDKGFRSCRFVSTIVKHPVYCCELTNNYNAKNVEFSTLTLFVW